MNDKEKLIMAALLHDIGKFWQRAGESGKHHEVSDKFIREYVPKNYETSGTFALFHHDKSKYFLEKGYNDLKKIVIADWLSSGEREELEDDEKGKPKITPLISVFSQINLNDKEKNDKIVVDYYYELNPLSTTKKTIFPKSERVNLSEEDYKNLWDEFINEIKNIKNIANFDEYFYNLYYILQKYTWCIPSAVYKSKPDVSLFDHLKTTCAIACCLYEQLNSEKEVNIDNLLRKEKWDKPLFSLIHGDISGIQNFIYNIKTKYAAKSLKGRSLFLVLLNKFIAEHVLKELDLPITNLLFCGGGHFYILTPKLSDEKVKEIRKEINEKLFKEFKTKLYLAIGKTDLCAKDFVDGNIAKKWSEVAEETGKQKMNRYKELDGVFEYLFLPSGEGGNKDICSICENEGEIIIKKEVDETYKLCKTCNSFIEFAKYLKNVQKEEIINTDKIKKEIPFLKEFNLLHKGNFCTTSKNVPFMNIPLGIPIKDGKIKTFEQLAEDWEEEEAKKEHIGAEKLGILKMDVDNLGKIFTEGLGEKATISRISILSGMMSLFFEGYLNKLIENEKYKNHIYLIYAGGDDTFIVGRWDKVIELSYDIYKDFREYTCKNNDITISAGIVIVSPKYPLRKSADKAKDMLEKAKEKGKNRIVIFDESLKWSINSGIDDFEKIREIKNILIKCINNGASKQLIQRIKGFEEERITESKKRKYIRGLKYYLHRNYKKNERLWTIIESELITIFDDMLNKSLFAKNKDDKYEIVDIPIAARLAELKIKGDKE